MSHRAGKQILGGVSVDHLVGVGAWEYDLRCHRLTWTDGVYDIFGLPRGIPLNRTEIVDMYHEGCRERMQALRAHIIQHGGGFTMEGRIWTDAGALRWMRLNAGVVMEAGRAVRIFGSKQDITDERKALERLRERADYDALTGLPNRGVFEARWQEVALGRQGDVSAIGIIDIDHFKRINDEYGHQVGDECLRITADRLRRHFGGVALVTRYGGDEFVLLWRGLADPEFLRRRFDRAQAALCEPVVTDGQIIPISVSIGVALRRLGRAPREMFRRADAALYQAKQGGRSATYIDGDVTCARALGGSAPNTLMPP